jgi:hypothetical protein
MPELRLSDLKQRPDADGLDVQGGRDAGVVRPRIAEPERDAEHEW